MKIMKLQISYKDLVNRDEQLRHFEELIHSKERMLLNKNAELMHVYNENQFLDSVRTDYDHYMKIITSQKEDQVKSLNLLNNYIQKLVMSGELQKYDIVDAKIEQKKIIREINHIKQNINHIISNADLKT